MGGSWFNKVLEAIEQASKDNDGQPINVELKTTFVVKGNELRDVETHILTVPEQLRKG